MEDVTRGSGKLDPSKYKNDVLTQAWVDSRVLATLLVWMESLNHRPRTMSEVVREPLKAMVKMLVDSGEVKMIDDTIVARQLLEKRTGVDLSRGGRGGKNTLHNVVLTSRRGELGDSLTAPTDDDVNIPLSEPVHLDPRTEEAMKKYEELFGDESE